jgi:gamma-glutamyltranspeptidase / glutathione hydrolase
VRYTPCTHRLQLISSRARAHLACRAHSAPRPVAGVVAALLALALGRSATAATPPPLRAAHAAVASDHTAASAAGVQLLRAGGNAIDAACATALALGVVNPHASGIGGGGFAIVYLAKQKQTHVLDFREQAPAAIRTDLYFKDGKPVRELIQRGGLAVGVPGEVRGLAELVRRFGRRPFGACVAPAERLARGFAASSRLAQVVAAPENRTPDRLAFLRQVFSYAEPLRPGDTVRRPAFARTLRELRLSGPEAFYRGRIAREIVAAVKAAGGVLTAEDLQKYAVLERQVIETDYRGHRVLSMPPPSSGGIVIAQALGILSQRVSDPGQLARGSSPYLHLLAETLKHGFADRARLLGDADFVQVPLARLLDPQYHRTLAARIDAERVLASDRYGMGATSAPPPKPGGTAHLSVIDSEGNAVALTTTVNTWFGAHLLAGRTGIVLNNQMDDFSLAPDTPNAFGLVGSAQNAVAPGKRPLSSMSPTVVLKDGAVKMVVGGAGGPTIITGVLQVLLNVLDHGLDAQAASAAPRMHHQWNPDLLALERDIPLDVVEALKRRGHKTEARDGLAFVNVIVRNGAELEAAAELRSGGGPAGY